MLSAKFKPKAAAPDPEFERLAEKRAAEKEALRQQHELAKAQMKGFGGMVTFYVKVPQP